MTETDETLSATRATRGEVLTYDGKPILAVFHSTAGGRTATAGEVWGEDLPYLRVIEVEEEDDAPHTYWRTQFTSVDLTGTCEPLCILTFYCEDSTGSWTTTDSCTTPPSTSATGSR